MLGLPSGSFQPRLDWRFTTFPAIDRRGFGAPEFNFLSFPGEEPPSIECNEDAGEEFIDN